MSDLDTAARALEAAVEKRRAAADRLDRALKHLQWAVILVAVTTALLVGATVFRWWHATAPGRLPGHP